MICDEVVRVIVNADDHLYQTALMSLVGDVLEPIPIAMNQSIRQFAKQLGAQLTNCLASSPLIPVAVRDAKQEAVHRFCHCLDDVGRH